MALIWGSDKAKYFSQGQLTGILCDCPSGKSIWTNLLAKPARKGP